MKEEEELLLENELIQVRILPSFGGKISSLRSVRTKQEFLLPPLRPRVKVAAAATFDTGDRGGFDECLPSVSSCGSIAGELPIPDHGDLWRLSWIIERQDEVIVLHAHAESRPLRLTRRASLQGASLMLEYELFNLSDKPTTWLWCAHPLLMVDAGDSIRLPDELAKLTVEYSAREVFKQGQSVSWPIAESRSEGLVNLSRVGERDEASAYKLFAQVGKSGWGALYRHAISQGLVLRFSPAELPYMGLWICSGAWPETDSARQFTVALEPTTANTDSLITAVRNGTSRTLAPREHCRWQLDLELLGASAPLNLGEFRSAIIATQ